MRNLNREWRINWRKEKMKINDFLHFKYWIIIENKETFPIIQGFHSAHVSILWFPQCTCFYSVVSTVHMSLFCGFHSAHVSILWFPQCTCLYCVVSSNTSRAQNIQLHVYPKFGINYCAYTYISFNFWRILCKFMDFCVVYPF